MEIKNELKEIDVKNRACYYFDDTMRVGYFGFDNILLDENSCKNSYENILIYDILYKTFKGSKPFRISFGKTYGFIKMYDVTRYLILFGSERYDAIYDRIRDLISKKGGITDSIIIILGESELTHIILYL